MSGGPIDWLDVDNWGKPGHNVHEAAWCADRHDDSEDAAERGR